LSRLPVRAVISSAFAFARDSAAWRATLRAAWPALLLYAGLSLWEAANPPSPEAAFGSIEAIPWSGFALAGMTAAAMRVRAFGPGARVSTARWLSLSLWVLAWSALLGAGLALLGAAMLGASLGLVAALPEATRAAFLAPFQQSPALAAGFAIAVLGAIGIGLVVAFLRLYLIVPAAAADRAVAPRGAWALSRGGVWALLAVFAATGLTPDLAAQLLADGAAALVPQERAAFFVSTLAYNALALVANQIAAAGWAGAFLALDTADEATDWDEA
jgi:hypothetical protein